MQCLRNYDNHINQFFMLNLLTNLSKIIYFKALQQTLQHQQQQVQHQLQQFMLMSQPGAAAQLPPQAQLFLQNQVSSFSLTQNQVC